MIQKAKTIVTSNQLQQQTEDNSIPAGVPFQVQDDRVSQEETPAISGGFPLENYPKASEETLQKIGEAEATKTKATNADLNTSKFENLVQKNSTRTLLRIKSAKLLDFFPDELIVETNKVNVSLRDYFFMRRLHTIALKDIEDVFVETTPFYATIKIVDQGFVENTVEVHFLRKNDAKRARRLIQGLISAYKEGIDVAALPDEALIEKLEILGSAGDIETVKTMEQPLNPIKKGKD